MNKINNLYIAIGGIGSRLKKGLKTLTFSSKCFISFNGKTLLERIVENASGFVDNIYIVYCTEEQRSDALKILGDCYDSHPVFYVENAYDDPYACLPTSGDCIAIMGDSYAPSQTYHDFFDSIFKERIMTVFKLSAERNNQDTAFYRFENGKAVDYCNSYMDGYQNIEIGQWIYFPQEVVEFAQEFCVRFGALALLRYFVTTFGVNCLDLKCFNMNTAADYHLIADAINE